MEKDEALRPISPLSSRFTLLLGFVAGLPALSIDLSAPSLALLPVALNTTVFVAGLSLSLFILGFGVGQFAGGRLSDQLGRRPILLTALAVYTFAGLCCSLATTGGQLATARLLQGAAAGACSVQSYAMVQDLFKGEAARRKQAYVSVVLTLMPMIAPAVGALVILVAGWRELHLLMALGGLILAFIVALFVSESRDVPAESPQRGTGVKAGLAMLGETGFRQVAVVNALSYGAIFTYIAGAPVVIINQFGSTTAMYAAVFACTAAALTAGASVNARLAGQFSASALVGPALVAQTIANVGLLGAAALLPASSPLLLLPLLIVGCFARGVLSPNFVHLALSGQREQAGLAAALIGLTQLATASAASALLARVLGQFGALSVGAIMAALSLAALGAWALASTGRISPQP